MLVVGSAIVGDWLQFFLAGLTLFLYLDREGLLVGQWVEEQVPIFLSTNWE
jgi:hypothetical protein